MTARQISRRILLLNGVQSQQCLVLLLGLRQGGVSFLCGGLQRVDGGLGFIQLVLQVQQGVLRGLYLLHGSDGVLKLPKHLGVAPLVH